MNDFKTSAPTENDAIERNADIVVNDFAVTFWSVIITEHRHRANDFDTRSICGYENNTLLIVMAFVVRVALAHHEMDLCSWVSCAADPPEALHLEHPFDTIYTSKTFIPFVTINYNLIAFLSDRCANVGGIR